MNETINNLYRSVDPTATILTLTEAKNELGIDGTDDDDRLTRLLKRTRDFIENQTDMAITPQTWVQSLPCFPSGKRPIYAKKVPVSAIAVQYYNEENVLTTLAGSEYYSLRNSVAYCIQPKEDWPTNLFDRPEAVVLTLTCGYASIPALAQEINCTLIAMKNEDREACYLEPKTYGIDKYIRALRRGIVC